MNVVHGAHWAVKQVGPRAVKIELMWPFLTTQNLPAPRSGPTVRPYLIKAHLQPSAISCSCGIETQCSSKLLDWVKKRKKNNRREEWWSPLKKLDCVMDGQGLQTLKPPPSVIHCHPAIISESLIHFASVWDLAKSITVAPICVCSDGGEGGGKKADGEDKLTARCAVSKHSLSCNNHLASFSRGERDTLIK